VIRPGASLPYELLVLFWWVQDGKPATDIAQRCEDIAAAYEARLGGHRLSDAHKHEMVVLLRQEADRFRHKADPTQSVHETTARDGLSHAL
jgi:hypothetical protein